MTRPNYFNILEELSKNACEAVRIACGRCGERGRECEKRQEGVHNKKRDRERLCYLRCECDRMICSLENSLFSDFIPPLQRDNIASLAHGFWRIISRASEHYSALESSSRSVTYENEEEGLCAALAEKLCENVAMLRHIRNPEKTPSLTEFRMMLREAGEAHNVYISRINSGAIPKTCVIRASSVARLRFEISRCFDCLIEVMLGNI